ncbi:MAG: chromosomal replication initiator protein DnaA [Actinomycetota bacterium]|nr:chromosomal replication initiator protein DnaA [Actinomycetota bacterium]MDH5223756.1 chromosomal replication initiator protein DnaA [Actinomycetota bacterium]MDH5313430.1 chromosomal replication initiator protein DnaA [Actinomycetota bacterium]
MALATPEHEAREAWAHVLERAREELPETTVVMWFADVRPLDLSGDSISLAVPSPLVRERLQHNHLALIERASQEAAGRPLKVEFSIDGALRGSSATDDAFDPRASESEAQPPPASYASIGAPSSPSPSAAPASLGAPGLPFPGYTFDAFVPGPSNRFAHAAAMAVAEAPPSTAYNPLFIYGGVGLGKTHLLIAVGHHMYRLAPVLRVKYVTSEQFVTEFIKAVRERQGGDAFRQRYREVDVLLVDDIQFLAKREETQTEFFHTFNHLHGAGKQIVIASDRPPHELSGLEERLVNRFRWGLCVDVQPPDLETRIAILQLKAEREHITVPPDVIEFAASKFDQSVRELEGALVRVVAWSELTGQPIDVSLAERALEDLIPQTQNEIPPPLILDETAKYFSLSPSDLMSKSRSRPLTQARHIAMYLTRECTGLSLLKIGEIFGGRDHTTVLHGIRKVEDEMRARDATFRQVQDLTRIIRGRVRAA